MGLPSEYLDLLKFWFHIRKLVMFYQFIFQPVQCCWYREAQRTVRKPGTPLGLAHAYTPPWTVHLATFGNLGFPLASGSIYTALNTASRVTPLSNLAWCSVSIPVCFGVHLEGERNGPMWPRLVLNPCTMKWTVVSQWTCREKALFIVICLRLLGHTQDYN